MTQWLHVAFASLSHNRQMRTSPFQTTPREEAGVNLTRQTFLAYYRALGWNPVEREDLGSTTGL